MKINTTTDGTGTNTAITYSECYQQCFCSDNLDLMKTIESNTIDLIYCDILYGTGKNFGDYQDLKPIRSEIENHYIPRIKEMHRILKDTGSIYLQMDCLISHWVRIIMDDIFGHNNFKNEIIWCYNSAQGSRKKQFVKQHDNLLFYTKTENYYFNKDSKELGYKPNESTIKRWGNSIDKDGNVLYEKLTPALKKKYYKQQKGFNIYKTLITDWWKINPPHLFGNSENVDYQTQKPKELLIRVIKASSKENDLVADFYLGSGTTAVVCKELNRNFIGCDINPKAIKITNERLSATLY